MVNTEDGDLVTNPGAQFDALGVKCLSLGPRHAAELLVVFLHLLFALMQLCEYSHYLLLGIVHLLAANQQFRYCFSILEALSFGTFVHCQLWWMALQVTRVDYVIIILEIADFHEVA